MNSIQDLKNHLAGSPAEAAQFQALFVQKPLKAQRSSQRLLISPIIEICLGILTLLIGGSNIGDNAARFLQHPVEALPSLSLYPFGLVSLFFGIQQIRLLQSTDTAGPIVEVQKRMIELQQLRILAGRWMCVVGLFLWVGIPILFAQAMFGTGVVTRISPAWTFSNLVFGLVSGVALVHFAKKAGDSNRFFAFLNREFTGATLLKLQAELEELKSL